MLDNMSDVMITFDRKCMRLTYIIGAWFASLCFLIIMVVFGALEMNKVEIGLLSKKYIYDVNIFQCTIQPMLPYFPFIMGIIGVIMALLRLCIHVYPINHQLIQYRYRSNII